MRKLFLFIAIALFSSNFYAQKGGLSPADLKTLKENYQPTAINQAIGNAVQSNDIKKLSINHSKENNLDFNYSNKVKTAGISDQESSGRCWLFTGLNVLRPKAMQVYNVDNFEFSQIYSFFYDQLEKSNLFLQGIIETSSLPMNDRKVEWLFKHPISDGGTWTGVVDITQKYGTVPQSVMTETYNSDNTRIMGNILTELLRKDGLKLRDLAKNGTSDKELVSQKIEMLKSVYHILCTTLGTPPEKFTWEYKSGNEQKSLTSTPLDFYKSLNVNLDDYVMFMNDPSRPYNKIYEIEFDRHKYDGSNWKYINLPNEKLKEMAKNAIVGNEALYFSCDVGKQLNKDKGVLDVDNYNFGALMQVDLSMDKTQRINTFESASSHAMTLIGVDLAKEDGTIKKWLLENSWGATYGHSGTLLMTNAWWDNYMFRVVIPKKYVPADILALLKQKAEMLPPWDPMFLDVDIVE